MMHGYQEYQMARLTTGQRAEPEQPPEASQRVLRDIYELTENVDPEDVDEMARVIETIRELTLRAFY